MSKEVSQNEAPSRAQKTTPGDLVKMAQQLRDLAADIESQAEKLKASKEGFAMIEGRQGFNGPTGALKKIDVVLASCLRKIKQR